MLGVERDTGWAFSKCLLLSSGYSVIHFSFCLNTVHKRSPVPRPQSLHFVEVISGWKSQGGEEELKLHWVYGAKQMLLQLIVPYYNCEKHLLPLVSLLIPA